ncbi:SDR family NAD(P)-dependent oxidoreductase [Caballeronia sp. 15711]|jgi:NAD(P)-dependent dehydrogenase (short-subunit alcohol dehydrogenase family)|uniref:SDR family NAD(P)-dependent oxidoreductase n=1 Tax=Caballeronia sp. 15711 TaxID=3391029 RepID=UPI0039E32691
MDHKSVHLAEGISERFKSKVVIVTGAGSVGSGWGNGRAVAVAMALEGAEVIAIDRDLESVRETLELAGDAVGRIHPVACDVTSSGAIRDVVEKVLSQFGRVDVVVNNVGGPAPGGPAEMSEEVWDSQVDLNLKSVFLMCKHTLPSMLAQKAGSIVNVSSTSGIRWTGNAQVAYAATKAGVIQLTRVMAVQYASQGIRANSVVPGQLYTPLVGTLAAARADGDLNLLLEQRLKRIPLGFFGDGRDTAAAVMFLASDEARFVTGTELVVDGGMSARCD